MKKAPDAFRTISEVSDLLDTPAHVLRFWESKFYQIRPVKRAGGRRYYRPDDVALINGVKLLLQDQGMTIRGVQRILQEKGVKHVVGLGRPALQSENVPDPQIIETETAESAPAETAQVAVEISPNETPTVPALSELAVDQDVSAPQAPETTEETPAAPVNETAEIESERAVQTPAPEPELPIAARQDTVDAASAKAAHAEPLTPPAPPEPPSPPEVPITELQDMQQPDEIHVQNTQLFNYARLLREKRRGQLGADKAHFDVISRRIESLLERMSEASGAGRW